MDYSESVEMYLEVIYQIEKSYNVVKSVDVSKKLGISKPSVTKALKTLTKKGLIIHEPYKDIILTDIGRKKAKFISEKHQYITDFLTQSLNIDTKLAEKDACRIEHVISADTITAIKRYLEKKSESKLKI